MSKMKYQAMVILAVIAYTAVLAWLIKEYVPPTWQVIVLTGAWVSLASVMVFDAKRLDGGENEV